MVVMTVGCMVADLWYYAIGTVCRCGDDSPIVSMQYMQQKAGDHVCNGTQWTWMYCAAASTALVLVVDLGTSADVMKLPIVHTRDGSVEEKTQVG